MKSKFLNIFIFIFLVFSLVGCAGEQGPVGPQGEQGIQGIQGEQGQPGKDGIDGEDGHTPVITIGENGNWYIDGVDTGVSSKGESGQKGEQGPQGEQGIQGEKGETGAQGQPGKDGVNGQDGHAPTITIGENGNWYIDGVDTGVLASGSKGEQGIQGETGKDGVDGTDGKDGLSAYEIFLKYYPDYAGSEEDWITDVAIGNTCNLFGHKWDEGVITTEPTKGNEGEKTYTCLICNEYKYEVLPKIEVANAEIYEIDGVKYVNYGSYPQTHVGDETLILELNKLTTPNSRGYYEYEGNEYAKVKTNPYQYGSYIDSYGETQYYQYSDGSTVNRNVVEWFIVEPIKWKIIFENEDSSYQLYSEYLLDATSYYDIDYLRKIDGVTIYQNNYKYSNIRAWLNGYNGTDYKVTDYTNKGFYDLAFKDNEKGAIVTKEVDNSASTTGSSSNEYECENTLDKIYLLSYKDILNTSYGFSSYSDDDTARCAQVTDYAKANGAKWITYSEYLNNAYYWLRSPDFYLYEYAYYVNCYGEVATHYDDVFNTYYGVRVACTINIEENK